MAIGTIIGLGLSAASMAQQNQAQRAAYRGQAATARVSSAATAAEAVEARLATMFEVGRMKKAGVRELSDIEAAFADAGVGLEEMTIDALLEAQTEIELAALMRQRAGRFEESQLKVESAALAQQEAEADKASKKKFLGLF